MFQMMNSARINVGVAGIGIAATAYQNASRIAKERIQGTDITRRKPGEIPIIDHPDIRRMLLWMKAAVDGMRSMAYTTGYWLDLAKESDNDKEGPLRLTCRFYDTNYQSLLHGYLALRFANTPSSV